MARRRLTLGLFGKSWDYSNSVEMQDFVSLRFDGDSRSNINELIKGADVLVI